MFRHFVFFKKIISPHNNIKVVNRFYRKKVNSIYLNCKMDVAYFRKDNIDDQLHITFRYKNEMYNIDRTFNFTRNINENVNSCLDRIKTNLTKEFLKKLKKQKNNENSPEVTAMFLKCDEIIDETTFEELLQNIVEFNLQVMDSVYKIEYNMPWVLSVKLPTTMLAGFTVYPSLLQIQFGTNEQSLGTWFRGKMPKSKNVEQIDWVKCGSGLSYNTTNDDVGFHLKFELTPGNGEEYGPPTEVISKIAVEAGPGRCPFEDRHAFTKTKLSSNEFRILSYNILADLYANTDFSRAELFSYCPPYALNVEYRKQLYMKEILGYQADILCFQEVDKKIFCHYLTPILRNFNYYGTMEEKGTCGEGLATFYDKTRFELLEYSAVSLGKQFAKLDLFQSVYEKISNNEKLLKRILNISTVLQISLLRLKESENIFIVANTHLYFHPNADHIRLLQAGLAMLYLEEVYKNTLKDYGANKDKVSIIFCGDFNSVPECGIFKLMTTKCVETDDIDWQSNFDEAIKNLKLSQPFNLKSAVGTPKFTNYTPEFADCLDYIFYQTDNIEVKEVIPLPCEEELRAHRAIPSVLFPSDHVALVVDLKLKKSL